MTAYFRAMRPHQWLKNVLIFAALLASHDFSADHLVHAALAFVGFCLIASATYIANDIMDVKADRDHPRKCRRPFASGQISVPKGLVFAGVLFALGILVALAVNVNFMLITLLYAVISLSYSKWLKKIFALDITVLAALYTIRILAGAVATNIEVSVWLLAFSIFFFLMLAAIKRQAELIDIAAVGKMSPNGRGYHVDDLPVIGSISVASGVVSVLVIVMYADSEPVRLIYSRPEMLWGVAPVLMFWIFRMAVITNRGMMHDDPLVFAAKDKVSYASFFVMLVLILLGTYL